MVQITALGHATFEIQFESGEFWFWDLVDHGEIRPTPRVTKTKRADVIAGFTWTFRSRIGFGAAWRQVRFQGDRHLRNRHLGGLQGVETRCQ